MFLSPISDENSILFEKCILHGEWKAYWLYLAKLKFIGEPENVFKIHIII